MYVENVYNGFIYNLAHHRMSAIIRYLWARKYRAVVVSHGVPHQMDPVDVGGAVFWGEVTAVRWLVKWLAQKYVIRGNLVINKCGRFIRSLP
jgi:lysozyme family protein